MTGYNKKMNLRDTYFYLQMKLLKAGDRVELLDMPNDPDPVPVGTQGTVVSNVPDPCNMAENIIGVEWDNGRTLNLCTEIDRAMKLEN